MQGVLTFFLKTRNQKLKEVEQGEKKRVNRYDAQWREVMIKATARHKEKQKGIVFQNGHTVLHSSSYYLFLKRNISTANKTQRYCDISLRMSYSR